MRCSFSDVVFIAALALLVCAPSITSAACEGTAPNDTLAACLGRDLREQDRKLNDVYRQKVQGLAGPEQTQLRDEQRVWLKQRDARCWLDSKESNRKHWFQAIERDPAKLVCVIRFTQERLSALQATGANDDLTESSLYRAMVRAATEMSPTSDKKQISENIGHIRPAGAPRQGAGRADDERKTNSPNIAKDARPT